MKVSFHVPSAFHLSISASNLVLYSFWFAYSLDNSPSLSFFLNVFSFTTKERIDNRMKKYSGDSLLAVQVKSSKTHYPKTQDNLVPSHVKQVLHHR